MKKLLISIIVPAVVYFIAAVGSVRISHYLAAWPLMLLEHAGVMGNNPEGFYNQWYGTSLITSLVVQASLVFLFLGKRHHANT